MVVDLNWELTILEIVHEFYRSLLREVLHDEVTPPRGLEVGALASPQRDTQQVFAAMQRWLRLLDMAITPEMLRHSLASASDRDIGEALLGYYARKQQKNDADRDKTDFVVTYLYRCPRVQGQWEQHGLSMDGAAPLPSFEIALMEILDGVEMPEPTGEQSRLVDEFQYLSEEAEQLNNFDQLMDSGVMQKARKIKNSFGDAFFHPHVLAAIAPYNCAFGRQFSELFDAATKQIRDYVAEFQRRGGSLSARVEGGVTLQELAEFDAPGLLGTEYHRAQERLHYLSRLKKAMLPKAGAAPATQESRAVAKESVLPLASDPAKSEQAGVISGPAQIEQELRIRSVEESIGNWVRAADERCRLIVPMKFGNFVITPGEADAYCADFLQEKSFRGDNARILIRMVAVMARILSEIEELRRRQNSTHLWRPHAQALEVLRQFAAFATQDAQNILEVATHRGLAEKIKILSNTVERLHKRVEEADQTLALASSGTSPVLQSRLAQISLAVTS